MIAELSEQSWYASDDSIDRQHTTDNAGGPDEDMVRGDTHMSCDQRHSMFCSSQSFGAGTGVRVAAVDENGPSDSPAQMQAIDDDRCGDHLILREDPGDGTALF